MSVIFNQKGRKLRTRPAAAKDTFTAANLEAFAKDMLAGKYGDEPRIRLTDPTTVGLRALISKTGTITFHVQYFVGDDRPYRSIGHYPELSIADARYLARVIREIGGMGIDPFANLERDRVNELLEQGRDWKPPAPKKKPKR